MIDILIITACIACVLDSATTYVAMIDAEQETNIIFRYIFKYAGLHLGSIIGLLISWYVVYRICNSPDLSSSQTMYVLGFLTITKTAVAHSNYQNKHNWITKGLTYMIPIYWNWGKIGKTLKEILTKR